MKTYILIAGMALVTFIPRVLPLIFLPGMKLPAFAERWLRNVAPAILSSLLIPGLVVAKNADGVPALSACNLYLFAAIPAFLAARKTKSLFAAVITGIITLAALRRII
jgi:branched-subunit amino acid transport protein